MQLLKTHMLHLASPAPESFRAWSVWHLHCLQGYSRLCQHWLLPFPLWAPSLCFLQGPFRLGGAGLADSHADILWFVLHLGLIPFSTPSAFLLGRVAAAAVRQRRWAQGCSNVQALVGPEFVLV